STEFAGLDADGKDADTHGSFSRLIGKFGPLLKSALVFEIPRKICGVVFGLKTDEIVRAQLWNWPFMVGQCGENFRWRERHMQKKADMVLVTAVAKHLCKRNEMVVVHPHDVIGLHQTVQLIRKMGVDTSITAQIAPGKFRKIEAIV